MHRYDRYTERAQDAVQRAMEILQRYGHTQIDTEHIMLALVEQPDGVVGQILESLTADVEALKRKLDEDLKSSPRAAAIYGAGGAGQVFITPRVNRIFEAAQQEAAQLNDEYISTEHIFLAIVGNRSSVPSARYLKDMGVTRERILEAIQ